MPFTPAVAWTAVVLSLGSIYFGAEHTGVWLLPILRTLSRLTSAHVREIHTVVRKSAHFTEYALLAVLWFRALAWRRSAIGATWLALCICLTCAVADEAHQSFLPSRTASARDVLIDGMGAGIALIIVRRFGRHFPGRREGLPAVGASLGTPVGRSFVLSLIRGSRQRRRTTNSFLP